MIFKRLNVLLLVVMGTLCMLALPAAAQEIEPISRIQITLSVDLPEDAYTIDELYATAFVIARRISGLDVGEPAVQIISDNRIQVQFIPQESRIDEVVHTVSETALLELVDFSGLMDQTRTLTGQHILTTGQAERGLDTRPDAVSSPLTGEAFATVLTGDVLQSAAAQEDPNTGSWIIAFELTPEGADTFERYTAAHIGEPLAIVLDGEVLSAPIIQTALRESGIITGSFTEQEARQLANQLQSGALTLPLSLESVEELHQVLLGD